MTDEEIVLAAHRELILLRHQAESMQRAMDLIGGWQSRWRHWGGCEIGPLLARRSSRTAVASHRGHPMVRKLANQNSLD
jgi:hypothetical protein